MGLGIYVVFAPHSVAASAIGVAIAGIGWVIRTLQTRSLGLRWSKFDLIIALSLLWTVASALLSEEPRISIAKLQASWCVFLFYLARATLTRRSALILVALLIVSGRRARFTVLSICCAGAEWWSSRLRPAVRSIRLGFRPGDTIWQINRGESIRPTDIDQDCAQIPPNTPVTVGIISQGEQVERSFYAQLSLSASGVIGTEHNHRFRASGWTRHYETFAELMQMIAQLALGLALAHLRNHGPNKIFRIAIVAAAFADARSRVYRDENGDRRVCDRRERDGVAIAARDDESRLYFRALCGACFRGGGRVANTRSECVVAGRSELVTALQVARVGLSRILIHPMFGHGMDAMQLHWNEWGFPGKDMLHLHSTPLQLAFDRGLPMLALWLWMMILFWLTIARAERRAADLSDTNYYGILLGTLGALTGFLMSSLVNYNYGDAEVAMMFWFLMGMALSTDYADSSSA